MTQSDDLSFGAKKLNFTPAEGLLPIAEMVARQIEIEQSLSNSRLTWNLTFQGFMIAGYALVATANASAPARGAVQGVICFVAGAIAVFTIIGLKASERQRDYLKAVWRDNDLSAYFPRPFSVGNVSRMGRSPARAICLVLIIMWVVLGAGIQFFSANKQDPTEIQLNGPIHVLGAGAFSPPLPNSPTAAAPAPRPDR